MNTFFTFDSFSKMYGVQPDSAPTVVADRITEEGDTRTTEEGDARNIES